jgi:hypothetical protein
VSAADRPGRAAGTALATDQLEAASELLGAPFREVVDALAQVQWAEEEITDACRRHPAVADRLFHAFPLLVPTAPSMRTEMVYRVHCREILERLASGVDTRPGTDAEMAITCCEMSQRAPMSTAGAATYMRVWRRAFPCTDVFDEHAVHYEHVAGAEADRLEREMRHKLAAPGRRLVDLTCDGMHHGEMTPRARTPQPPMPIGPRRRDRGRRQAGACDSRNHPSAPACRRHLLRSQTRSAWSPPRRTAAAGRWHCWLRQ